MNAHSPTGSAADRQLTVTTSDGVELFVSVKGQGTPCLYIHGGPGSGSYWMEKFSDGMLERHFTMIYLDQRGVGRSTSPSDADYSMDRMVQDFEEVRSALGIEAWLTLGHSFGGLFQMGYVLRRPQAHLGMIFLNASVNLMDSFNNSWGPKGCEILGIEDSPDQSIPVIERMSQLGSQMRERGLFWKMAYREKKNEEIMAATFGEIPNFHNDQEEPVMSNPEYFEDFSDRTAQVSVPVLFFYGTTDWMVGPDHYKQAHFPNMLLWESQVGHVAIMENKPDLDRALSAYQEKYHL